VHVQGALRCEPAPGGPCNRLKVAPDCDPTAGMNARLFAESPRRRAPAVLVVAMILATAANARTTGAGRLRMPRGLAIQSTLSVENVACCPPRMAYDSERHDLSVATAARRLDEHANDKAQPRVLTRGLAVQRT